MKRNLAALAAGALFGIGLTVSQMANPAKVLAFLDIAGNWDPSLMFVMGGAVAVTMVTFRLILRRSHPLFAPQFAVPSRREIDRRLLAGAAVFGLGWGLAGYCPGPAFAALGFGTHEPWMFLLAMTAGSVSHAGLTATPTAPLPEPADG